VRQRSWFSYSGDEFFGPFSVVFGPISHQPLPMSRWISAAIAIQLAHGCAGGVPGGQGVPIADGSPGSDGAVQDSPIRPAREFPLRISANGTSLVSDNGAPFHIHGEAAWSLIIQPSLQGAQMYLADRERRGVNTILVNLIEHKFSDRPPANAAGDAPFKTPGDLSTPNDAYFSHADKVLDLAAKHGIAVMLFPAYLGFAGGDEGWFSTMSQLSAEKCRSYGDYLGHRYAARTNLVWMWGGDFTPPVGSAGERCMKAIADGIRAAAPNALASAHWKQETTSRDETTFAAMIDLVGVYTYANALALCRSARSLSPKRPTYLIETTYENERGVALAEIRAQQWRGLIGCGAGEISGTNPIWQFGISWAAQLDSPLSKAQTRLHEITKAVRIADLLYDNLLIASGRGTGASEVVSGRTGDGTQAIIYLPQGAATTIGVDLSHMAAPVTATWHDPTAAQTLPAGSGLTGNRTFTTPGVNANGSRDWVLVLNTGP
jgi:2-hydroxychromene-2-carboxylate isomerase